MRLKDSGGAAFAAAMPSVARYLIVLYHRIVSAVLLAVAARFATLRVVNTSRCVSTATWFFQRVKETTRYFSFYRIELASLASNLSCFKKKNLDKITKLGRTWSFWVELGFSSFELGLFLASTWFIWLQLGLFLVEKRARCCIPWKLVFFWRQEKPSLFGDMFWKGDLPKISILRSFDEAMRSHIIDEVMKPHDIHIGMTTMYQPYIGSPCKQKPHDR